MGLLASAHCVQPTRINWCYELHLWNVCVFLERSSADPSRVSERSHCWKGLWSLEVHFAKAWAGWLYLDVMQVTSPVQWETTLKTLLGKGLQSSYELGPGKVMSRLILLFICECVPHSALLHTWNFNPTVIANTSVIKVTRIAWPTTGFPPNPHTNLLWISTSTCFFGISRHVVKDVLTWGLSWTLSVCHTLQ